MDAESPNMQFYWDFDAEIDSDADGIADNDIDASGEKVIQDFQNRGTFQVICTVVNDAGVSTQVTYYVTVRALADDDTGLSPTIIALLAVLLTLIVVGGVGIMSWRRMSNARLEALLAEQAEAEEEEPRELSVEEQKAMFGAGSVTLDQPASMSTTSPFGQYGTGMSGASDSQATISSDAAMGDSDLEALMSTPGPITADAPSSPAADLLAEFGEDDSVDLDDMVEFSHDEGGGTGAEIWSPEAVIGDELADSLPAPPAPDQEPDANSLLDDDLPAPPPPVSEDLPSPPSPEEIESNQEDVEDSVEEQESDETEPESRLVQQDCSQCEQRFEVTLPEGHDVARTACPSCGAIETVSL
jgi:hypothetical protein